MEEELRKTFVELAKFVQQIGPDVWAIMVKQQIIVGISTIVLWVISGISTLFGIKVLQSNPKWAQDSIGDNVGGFVITVVSACAFVILFVVLVIHGIPRILNPQYYALMALKP